MMPGARPSVASPVQYQYIENVAVSVDAEANPARIISNNSPIPASFMTFFPLHSVVGCGFFLLKN